MKWAGLAAAALLLPGPPEAYGLVRLGRSACGEDDVLAFVQKQVLVHHEPAALARTAANRSFLNATRVGANASFVGGHSRQAEAGEADGHAALQMDRHSWLLAVIGVETLVIFVTIGIPIFTWFIASAIGRSVKFGIETCDQLFLGTDVTIGSLETNIFRGTITVDTLEVQNPVTNNYDSPYLLKAGLVHVDINMVALVCSFFRHVEIESLNFRNVDVIYEKAWNSSNVQDTLNFLRGKGNAPANDGQQDDGKEAKGKPKKDHNYHHVTLHEVVVEDVGARVQAQLLGGRGMRVSVGDIGYSDFDAEVGEHTTGPIIQVLLKSVLKTVIANIAGKQISESCM